MASKHNTPKLVKDLKSSGLTHKAYCLQHNIPASTLAYHLRKHRMSLEANAGHQDQPSFIPVDLKATGSSIRTLIICKGEFTCDELIKIASSNL